MKSYVKLAGDILLLNPMHLISNFKKLGLRVYIMITRHDVGGE